MMHQDEDAFAAFGERQAFHRRMSDDQRRAREASTLNLSVVEGPPGQPELVRNE